MQWITPMTGSGTNFLYAATSGSHCLRGKGASLVSHRGRRDGSLVVVPSSCPQFLQVTHDKAARTPNFVTAVTNCLLGA